MSPDSRFLAYRSTESGTEEIYVQPFPPNGSKWQVSTSGGIEAFWADDGRQLYYISGNKLMLVSVSTEHGKFEAGIPKPLFETRLAVPTRNRVAPARNGQRFLVNRAMAQTESGSVTVLLNCRRC